MSDMSDDDSFFKEAPLLYKLLLRFPKLSLDCFPEKFQGVFWAIFVPIFIVCYVYLNLVIVVFSSFPINLFLVGSMFLFVFLFVFRIHIDRVLNSQKTMLRKPPYVDIKERVTDYLHYFDKKMRKERIRSDSDPEESNR